MAAPAATDECVYRVLEPFSFDHGGRTYVMKRGDIVSGDNPAYRGREGLFEEVTAQAAREAVAMRTRVSAIETATAVPGEPRRMEIDASIPEEDANVAVGEARDTVPTPHPAPPAPPAPQPTPSPAPAPDPTPTPTSADAAAATETTSDTPVAPTRKNTSKRVLKDQPQA
jgi:hypothetical protein